MTEAKPRILVLCTGNSCRSQMAEGFLRTFGGEQFDVASAGLTPKGVHPLAIDVMAEAGIDISGQKSSSVRDFAGQQFRYVITVCDHAAEHCPVFPGETIRLHWPFPDPAHATGSREEVLAVFRAVRDEIGTQCRRWLETNPKRTM